MLSVAVQLKTLELTFESVLRCHCIGSGESSLADLVWKYGRFATATDEFTLSVLEVDGPEVKRPSRGFEILINVGGDAAISQPGGTEALPLRQGASVAIPATVEQYWVSGSARLYVAGFPNT